MMFSIIRANLKDKGISFLPPPKAQLSDWTHPLFVSQSSAGSKNSYQKPISERVIKPPPEKGRRPKIGQVHLSAFPQPRGFS